MHNPSHGVLGTAGRMAAIFRTGMSGAMPGPAAIPDPGFFVSQEEIDDYCQKLSNYRRDMNDVLEYYETTGRLSPAALDLKRGPYMQWAEQWLPKRKDLTESNWYVTRDDWDDVRKFHLRLVELQRQMEAHGVNFDNPAQGGPAASYVPGSLNPGAVPPGAPTPPPGVNPSGVSTAAVPGTPMPGAIRRPGDVPSSAEPSKKGDDVASFLPSTRTLAYLGIAAAGVYLAKTWLENR